MRFCYLSWIVIVLNRTIRTKSRLMEKIEQLNDFISSKHFIFFFYFFVFTKQIENVIFKVSFCSVFSFRFTVHFRVSQLIKSMFCYQISSRWRWKCVLHWSMAIRRECQPLLPPQFFLGVLLSFPNRLI